MRLRPRWIFVVVVALGCATSQPARIPPRPGTEVAASFGKTWNALQVVLAEQAIPIRSTDREHGLVIAEDQAVPGGIDEVADCGYALHTRVRPVRARWDMLVRGDSVNAIVRATVRFVDPTGDECTSLGTWETALERRVKQIAEIRN